MVFETFPLSLSVCVCVLRMVACDGACVCHHSQFLSIWEFTARAHTHIHTQSVCSLFHFHLENICQCTHASLLFKSIALKLEVFIQRCATLGFHSMNTYFIWYLYILHFAANTHGHTRTRKCSHIHDLYPSRTVDLCWCISVNVRIACVCVWVNQSNLFKIRLGANKNLRLKIIGKNGSSGNIDGNHQTLRTQEDDEEKEEETMLQSVQWLNIIG